MGRRPNRFLEGIEYGDTYLYWVRVLKMSLNIIIIIIFYNLL